MTDQLNDKQLYLYFIQYPWHRAGWVIASGIYSGPDDEDELDQQSIVYYAWAPHWSDQGLEMVLDENGDVTGEAHSWWHVPTGARGRDKHVRTTTLTAWFKDKLQEKDIDNMFLNGRLEKDQKEWWQLFDENKELKTYNKNLEVHNKAMRQTINEQDDRMMVLEQAKSDADCKLGKDKAKKMGCLTDDDDVAADLVPGEYGGWESTHAHEPQGWPTTTSTTTATTTRSWIPYIKILQV